MKKITNASTTYNNMQIDSPQLILSLIHIILFENIDTYKPKFK